MIYGSLAFGLGFLFGTLREIALKPALGDATGTLVEFVLVTGAVVTLGIWLSRCWPAARSARLARGIGGAIVLLVLEGGLAIGVMGQPLDQYLISFDVSAGALFPFGLAVMAVAPVLARWR